MSDGCLTEAAMGRRQADRLRAMYPGGRGNAVAHRYTRFWNRVMRLGLLPPRWVTLEVVGRRTGATTSFPLGMADVGGRWYLVSMLGECNWVANVRAAGGHATLRRRRSRPVLLVDVAVGERAAILKRYARKVPGGRPHLSVDRHESVGAFEAIAANHPVFEVLPNPAVG
jgi:deazaflavin-dependent oxidoreductase (nitroreductase family)